MAELRSTIPFRQIPFFDHRIDELLEVAKRFFEVQYGLYWSETYENVSIQPNTRKRFLSAGECFLKHTIIKITMPDSTSPDVRIVVTSDGYTTEDDPVTSYHGLGLNHPNSYGWYTVYDTENYIYAWIIPWNIYSAQSLLVEIYNKTNKTVTVNKFIIDGTVRPYKRYLIKRKIRK